MARSYGSISLCDYLCKSCGNVNKSFDVVGSLSPKFSEKIVYCSNCQCDTINYKLGDKDIVKAELDSYSELEGIYYEIWDLLNVNKYVKRR